MKKNKTFFIRVDLESDKGIKEGVPKLLEVFNRNGVKGSFYLSLGGESNIFELLRYRKKMESSAERSIRLWSLREKIRMAFFPRDFVLRNKNILKRIVEEEHELGIHGWKHRAWTRGLNKINIDEHIKKAINKYKKLFDKNLISFSSPGFNVNKKVLESLEKEGINFISDFSDKKIKNYGQIKNIPLTILGENKMPIIEYLVGKGRSDKEILKKFEEEIKGKELVSFYIHGLFEGRFKTELLDKIIKLLKNEKFINKRIIDY